MTENESKLEKNLMRQMGIDDEKILKDWETEPFLMDNATVLKFWNYIKNATAVTIVGDYDCDGVMASLIMSKAIKHVDPKKPVKVKVLEMPIVKDMVLMKPLQMRS